MINQHLPPHERLWKAFTYSLNGFYTALRYEQAFRHESLLFIISVPLAYHFAESPLELAILVASVLLILIVELLNSAVEAAIDRIGFEHHEFSRRAKDMGSAAVFCSLVLAAIVWLGVIL